MSGQRTSPLSGVRVLEIGTLPAAAYCARFFADFGAEVIKVEPTGGDPARSTAPMIDDGRGGRCSGWFSYLNFGKRSLVVDAADPRAAARVAELLADADVLIDSTGAGDGARYGLDHARLRERHPRLVVIGLSWFGPGGPYSGFRGADAVCRALAGKVQPIGPIEGPPLALPDYHAAIVGGLSAFIPLMASLHARARNGAGGAWQSSVLESEVALAEFQATEGHAAGVRQPRGGINRFSPTYPLGIYRCRSGWLGITVVTPHQWASLCELLGMDELAHDPGYAMGPERLEHAETLEPRLIAAFRERSAAEWFEEGLRMKLPFAIVPEMRELLATPVFRDRGTIVPIRVGARTVEAPGSPLHLTRTPPLAGGTVPELDECSGTGGGWQTVAAGRDAAPRALTLATGADIRSAVPGPLAGVRIVDLAMGWAGPICTRNMADLGADVIKVEACGYHDWWRGTSTRMSDFEQQLYEKQPRFIALNHNKRAITLDLTSAEGARLLKELVRGADAVVENYSSEVLPKLGLDYARLREVNPQLVMVSMAAFGATGPWSACRAYGSTLEQGSGLPTVAGREGDPPLMTHIAHGDAVGGLNAASALMVGLWHRLLTGEGQHIDLSQVECMMPFTAPWAIEQSASGRVSPRLGNRHPDHAPQGVYPCAGHDAWVLVTVADDGMWRALCGVLGDAALAGDASLADAAGRRRAHDRIDASIAAWTRTRSPDEAMNTLQAAGVAAGAVRAPVELIVDPHLQARGFWQMADRPFVGRHPQPSPPYRAAAGSSGSAPAAPPAGSALPAAAAPPPIPIAWPGATLGQFNAEVLKGVLGMSDADLARLESAGVIGTVPLSPMHRKRGASKTAQA